MSARPPRPAPAQIAAPAAPHRSPPFSRSGVRLKTRKRNIVVPNDPQAFADAVIDVITDAFEEAGGDVAKTLDAANKVLDGAELDFSR